VDAIRVRREVEDNLRIVIQDNLVHQNKGFTLWQTEAPLLTPVELLSKNYGAKDVYFFDRPLAEASEWDRDWCLRPETTMGSYAYAKYLLEHTELKIKLPLVVWQHGKSFRREQDQPTKFMRLKEFYQLEFQIIYSDTTKNDYSVNLIPDVQVALEETVGPCRVEPSDRLPFYAEWTQDIVAEATDMEICSISLRNDFGDVPNSQGNYGARVLEIAIGTDRCAYNAIKRRNEARERCRRP
tara:strand:+ start:288 stop:1007 length:720 start_codon:yes stop_codon:yes gene_type:complete